MTGLRIQGFAAISSAGDKPGALAERVTVQTDADWPGSPAGTVTQEPLPDGGTHAFADFDIRARLGRKGTSFYDRATGLAVVVCGDALEDGGLVVDDTNRARVGVALGTTLGSFKSTSDYTRETLVQEKPYLVNPMLFPNTVMNCAAGQSAIRHGLKGINATITGGPLAFFNALRYAGNAIARGYVDTMLVGAVEEFSAHRAWLTALHPGSDGTPAGDGAAVFVLAAAGAGEAGRGAEISAVATGYGPGGRAGKALESCVTRVLRAADVQPSQVTLLATAEIGTAAASWDVPGAESGPAIAALGHRPKELLVSRSFGDCGAATPALALATVLELHRADPALDGRFTLLTARGADGAVGAVLVRGCSRAGADRG